MSDPNKARFDLIPPGPLYDVAEAFKVGADNHGERNWEDGSIPISRFFAAAMRHAWAWWRGEDLDPESGLPHEAHVATNWLIIAELRRRRLSDDRPGRRRTLRDRLRLRRLRLR